MGGEYTLGIGWAAVAVILVMTEIISGTLVLLCVALGALASALVSVFAGFEWQLVAFIIVTGISLLVVKKSISVKYKNDSGRLSNVDAMVGKVGRVDEDILPDIPGWVSIDGDVWKAFLVDKDAKHCHKGDRVVVRRIESLILYVEIAGDS